MHNSCDLFQLHYVTVMLLASYLHDCPVKAIQVGTRLVFGVALWHFDYLPFDAALVQGILK